MRLIDADALMTWLDNCYDDEQVSIGFVVGLIKDTPTINAVEVVRCKECKHYSIEGETTQFGWCGYWNKPTDEMRYCSDGERRE